MVINSLVATDVDTIYDWRENKLRYADSIDDAEKPWYLSDSDVKQYGIHLPSFDYCIGDGKVGIVDIYKNNRLKVRVECDTYRVGGTRKIGYVSRVIPRERETGFFDLKYPENPHRVSDTMGIGMSYKQLTVFYKGDVMQGTFYVFRDAVFAVILDDDLEVSTIGLIDYIDDGFCDLVKSFVTYNPELLKMLMMERK